jgi:ABC-type transport system involved in cytochrome bd biosynthesis fused ATPase/permease subunit
VLGPVAAVGVTAIGALAITVAIDATAGLVLLASLLFVGVVIPAVTMRGERSIGPPVTDARAALGGRVLAVTEGLDQLWANRMFIAARRDIEVPGQLIDELEQRRARLRMLTGAIVTAAPLLTATATLAVLSASSGSLSGPAIGVLVLWPLAILELVGSVNEATASVPSIAGSAHRVITLLDTPDPIVPPSDPQPVPSLPTLVLDGATARWPGSDDDALAPVTMCLVPGSFAEIDGPSGSGKSTLAAVLVAFLAARSGDYRLDDVRVDDVAGSDIRGQVTWIQQLPWIADSTVRENLRIADPTADDDQLVAALDGVRLGQWLRDLPAGLDSRLGRGGAAMSGGEAQRLALARVLLAGHEVVVLDEPTANLDAETAGNVLTTVLEHCSTRTTVLLGHR